MGKTKAQRRAEAEEDEQLWRKLGIINQATSKKKKLMQSPDRNIVVFLISTDNSTVTPTRWIDFDRETPDIALQKIRTDVQATLQSKINHEISSQAEKSSFDKKLFACPVHNVQLLETFIRVEMHLAGVVNFHQLLSQISPIGPFQGALLVSGENRFSVVSYEDAYANYLGLAVEDVELVGLGEDGNSLRPKDNSLKYNIPWLVPISAHYYLKSPKDSFSWNNHLYRKFDAPAIVQGSVGVGLTVFWKHFPHNVALVLSFYKALATRACIKRQLHKLSTNAIKWEEADSLGLLGDIRKGSKLSYSQQVEKFAVNALYAGHEIVVLTLMSKPSFKKESCAYLLLTAFESGSLRCGLEMAKRFPARCKLQEKHLLHAVKAGSVAGVSTVLNMRDVAHRDSQWGVPLLAVFAKEFYSTHGSDCCTQIIQAFCTADINLDSPHGNISGWSHCFEDETSRHLFGYHAIHLAVLTGSYRLVEALVDRGVNCNLEVEGSWYTPYILALDQKAEIADYLVYRGNVDIFHNQPAVKTLTWVLDNRKRLACSRSKWETKLETLKRHGSLPCDILGQALDMFKERCPNMHVPGSKEPLLDSVLVWLRINTQSSTPQTVSLIRYLCESGELEMFKQLKDLSLEVAVPCLYYCCQSRDVFCGKFRRQSQKDASLAIASELIGRFSTQLASHQSDRRLQAQHTLIGEACLAQNVKMLELLLVANFYAEKLKASDDFVRRLVALADEHPECLAKLYDAGASPSGFRHGHDEQSKARSDTLLDAIYHADRREQPQRSYPNHPRFTANDAVAVEECHRYLAECLLSFQSLEVGLTHNSWRLVHDALLNFPFFIRYASRFFAGGKQQQSSSPSGVGSSLLTLLSSLRPQLSSHSKLWFKFLDATNTLPDGRSFEEEFLKRWELTKSPPSSCLPLVHALSLGIDKSTAFLLNLALEADFSPDEQEGKGITGFTSGPKRMNAFHYAALAPPVSSPAPTVQMLAKASVKAQDDMLAADNKGLTPVQYAFILRPKKDKVTRMPLHEFQFSVEHQSRDAQSFDIQISFLRTLGSRLAEVRIPSADIGGSAGGMPVPLLHWLVSQNECSLVDAILRPKLNEETREHRSMCGLKAEERRQLLNSLDSEGKTPSEHCHGSEMASQLCSLKLRLYCGNEAQSILPPRLISTVKRALKPTIGTCLLCGHEFTRRDVNGFFCAEKTSVLEVKSYKAAQRRSFEDDEESFFCCKAHSLDEIPFAWGGDSMELLSTIDIKPVLGEQLFDETISFLK